MGWLCNMICQRIPAKACVDKKKDNLKKNTVSETTSEVFYWLQHFYIASSEISTCAPIAQRISLSTPMQSVTWTACAPRWSLPTYALNTCYQTFPETNLCHWCSSAHQKLNVWLTCSCTAENLLRWVCALGSQGRPFPWPGSPGCRENGRIWLGFPSSPWRCSPWPPYPKPWSLQNQNTGF